MTRIVGGGCRLELRAPRLFGLWVLVTGVVFSFAFAASSARAITNPLFTVACPSVSQCTALDAPGHEVTFNPMSGSPNAAGVKLVLPGANTSPVACVNPTQCTAVSGFSEVTFDPASGQAQRPVALAPPNPDPSCPAYDPSLSEPPQCYYMLSVACPQASECVAVDETGKEVTFDPVTGTTSPAGWNTIDNGGPLEAVACPSATQCTAVDDAGHEVTFDPTLARDSSAGVKKVWSMSARGYPRAVACASVSQCTALDGDGREVTFDPTSGIVNAAGVKHIVSAALDLSCSSATQCTIVDASGHEITLDPTSGAVNAAGLSLVDPPTPGECCGHYLWAVACVSSSQCTAVDDAGDEVTFDPSTGTPNAAGVRWIDSPNSLVLSRAKLKVVRGRAQVPLSCQSSTECRGTLRIVTGSGRRLVCTPAAGASFSIASAQQKTVKIRLLSSCMARLKTTRGHRVAAAIFARLGSGQHGLTAPVQLVLG